MSQEPHLAHCSRCLADYTRAVPLTRRGAVIALGGGALEREASVTRLARSGAFVIRSLVAPEEAVRQKAADVIGRERFLVVHLDCPLEICRQRDTDGHYELADSGDIALFPGVSAPYELPTDPDLLLDTSETPPAECVAKILELLASRQVLM